MQTQVRPTEAAGQPVYIGPALTPAARIGQGNSARNMIRSRSVLLSYLLKLKRSIDARHADLTQAICQRFVQSLTDYLSYGHFRLLNGCEAEAHQIVALQNNTQTLLEFTERYAATLAPDLQQLKDDLEELAMALEVRFEVEDEVVVKLIRQ